MRPHRRYSEGEKKALLATPERAQEQSGKPLIWILIELGLTRSVYYDWLEKAVTMPRPIPGMDIAILPG